MAINHGMMVDCCQISATAFAKFLTRRRTSCRQNDLQIRRRGVVCSIGCQRNGSALGEGLPTPPKAPTEGLPRLWETFGRTEWLGRETSRSSETTRAKE